MTICKHCLLEISTIDKPKGFMANHSRWCDKNPKLSNYKNSLVVARNAITSDIVATRNASIQNAWKIGKYDDANLGTSFKGKFHTIESKQKISNKLKIAHADERHPGWANANKINKSYPERLFETYIKDRGFFDTFNISQQFRLGKYLFDFAFVDLKIDVEIDGCQHYRTIESIKYDNIRDSFALDKGWRVYRISAKELKHNTNKIIDDFLIFINSKNNYRKYDF